MHNLQIGLGHGQSATEKLDDLTTHNVEGHRIILIHTEETLKAVCRNCSQGREVPFEVRVHPGAKEYVIGEFIVESGECYHSN